MKGKDCFLRFSHRGFTTNSLTLPGGTEGKLELGLRGDVRSVRFYLGNDDGVILRQDAAFSRQEGDYQVYEVPCGRRNSPRRGGDCSSSISSRSTPTGGGIPPSTATCSRWRGNSPGSCS